MIYDNSPTLGYVRITEVSATYNNKLYVIPSFYTCKSYIYWSPNNPSTYIAQNVLREEKADEFLVAVNKGGVHTTINIDSDKFNIDLEGRAPIKRMEELVYGVYEDLDSSLNQTLTKFSNIKTDIDSINTKVGQVEADLTGTKENISSVSQKMDSINMSLTESVKEIANTTLRDFIVDNYLSYVTELGLIQTTLKEISIDGLISDELDPTIGVVCEKEAMEQVIVKIKKITKRILDTSDRILMESSILSKFPILESKLEEFKKKNKLNGDELEQAIKIILSSGRITQLNRTTLYNKILEMTSEATRQMKEIEKYIIMGYGGSIVDTIGKLTLKPDKAAFYFQEKVNDQIKRNAIFQTSLNGVTSKVENVKIGMSNIQQSVQMIKAEIASNKGQMSAIEQKASQISLKVESMNSSLAQIKIKTDEITSTVTDKLSGDGFKEAIGTVIKQGKENILYAINGGDKKALIDFNKHGVIIKKGIVATSSLGVPDIGGQYNPVIYLCMDERGNNIFPSWHGAKAEPCIDCTQDGKVGIGDKIRLQWNKHNYWAACGESLEGYVKGEGGYNGLLRLHTYGVDSRLTSFPILSLFNSRGAEAEVLTEANFPLFFSATEVWDEDDRCNKPLIVAHSSDGSYNYLNITVGRARYQIGVPQDSSRTGYVKRIL